MKRFTLFAWTAVGLLFAACTGKNEPTANEVTPPAQVDNFMKHVSDLDNACFLKSHDYNSCMVFRTDSKNEVAYFYEKNAFRKWEYMCETNYVRKGTDISDSVGYFDIPEHTYSFFIEINDVQGYHSWHLINYPDYCYSSSNPNSIANLAQNRGADDAIPEAIKAGQGQWSEENPGYEGVQAVIESKGAKVGLRHSDFGVYDMQYRLSDSIMQQIGSVADGLEGNIYHNTRIYGGGVYRNNAADEMANVKYVGTAVAQLDETDGMNKRIIYTDSAAASLTVDEQMNETIVMPFKNWYHVTIIKTSNHITMNLTDTEGVVSSPWTVPTPSATDFDAKYDYLENGFYALHSNNFEEPFKGRMGVEWGDKDPDNNNIGVRTCVVTDLFGDTKSDPSEVIVQGYRTDRNLIGANKANGLFFGFTFGGVRQ